MARTVAALDHITKTMENNYSFSLTHSGFKFPVAGDISTVDDFQTNFVQYKVKGFEGCRTTIRTRQGLSGLKVVFENSVDSTAANEVFELGSCPDSSWDPRVSCGANSYVQDIGYTFTSTNLPGVILTGLKMRCQNTADGTVATETIYPYDGGTYDVSVMDYTDFVQIYLFCSFQVGMVDREGSDFIVSMQAHKCFEPAIVPVFQKSELELKLDKTYMSDFLFTFMEFNDVLNNISPSCSWKDNTCENSITGIEGSSLSFDSDWNMKMVIAQFYLTGGSPAFYNACIKCSNTYYTKSWPITMTFCGDETVTPNPTMSSMVYKLTESPVTTIDPLSLFESSSSTCGMESIVFGDDSSSHAGAVATVNILETRNIDGDVLSMAILLSKSGTETVQFKGISGGGRQSTMTVEIAACGEPSSSFPAGVYFIPGEPIEISLPALEVASQCGSITELTMSTSEANVLEYPSSGCSHPCYKIKLTTLETSPAFQISTTYKAMKDSNEYTGSLPTKILASYGTLVEGTAQSGPGNPSELIIDPADSEQTFNLEYYYSFSDTGIVLSSTTFDPPTTAGMTTSALLDGQVLRIKITVPRSSSLDLTLAFTSQTELSQSTGRKFKVTGSVPIKVECGLEVVEIDQLVNQLVVPFVDKEFALSSIATFTTNEEECPVVEYRLYTSSDHSTLLTGADQITISAGFLRVEGTVTLTQFSVAAISKGEDIKSIPLTIVKCGIEIVSASPQVVEANFLIDSGIQTISGVGSWFTSSIPECKLATYACVGKEYQAQASSATGFSLLSTDEASQFAKINGKNLELDMSKTPGEGSYYFLVRATTTHGQSGFVLIKMEVSSNSFATSLQTTQTSSDNSTTTSGTTDGSNSTATPTADASSFGVSTDQNKEPESSSSEQVPAEVAEETPTKLHSDAESSAIELKSRATAPAAVMAELQRKFLADLAQHKASASSSFSPEEEEEPEPVELLIQSITRNGRVLVVFNQPLFVPFDFGSEITPSEVDLSRDVFKVSFELNSDANSADVVYELILFEWNDRYMQFDMLFEKPLIVSTGQDMDKVILTVRNEQHFTSKESLLQPEAAELILEKVIPTQLPADVLEEDIDEAAESSSETLLGLMIALLLLQIVLKTLVDKLWLMVLTIQVAQSFRIYNKGSKLPANAVIYSNHIKSVINFEFLSLPRFYDLFLKDKADFLKFWKDDPELGATNLFVNLSNFITVFFIGFSLASLLLCIGFLLKTFRSAIYDKLRAFKKKMLFNGIIRSVTLGWVQLCISVAAQLSVLNLSGRAYLGVIILSFGGLCLYPVFVGVYLRRNFSVLGEETMKTKVGNFYTQTRYSQPPSTNYYPAFLVRRVAFILTPSLFASVPNQQYIALVASSQAYLMMFSHQNWLADKTQFYLEILNECGLMILNYHMLCFTDFVGDRMVHYRLGNSFLAVILLLVVCNLSLMCTKSIQERMDSRRRARIKELQEKQAVNLLAVKYKNKDYDTDHVVVRRYRSRSDDIAWDEEDPTSRGIGKEGAQVQQARKPSRSSVLAKLYPGSPSTAAPYSGQTVLKFYNSDGFKEEPEQFEYSESSSAQGQEENEADSEWSFPSDYKRKKAFDKGAQSKSRKEGHEPPENEADPSEDYSSGTKTAGEAIQDEETYLDQLKEELFGQFADHQIATAPAPQGGTQTLQEATALASDLYLARWNSNLKTIPEEDSLQPTGTATPGFQ